MVISLATLWWNIWGKNEGSRETYEELSYPFGTIGMTVRPRVLLGNIVLMEELLSNLFPKCSLILCVDAMDI